MAQSNGLGVAGLVLGIASIVLCWVPFLGLASGIVGLVCSVKQRKAFPNGIATGGLVTSIIGTVFSVLYTIFWIFFAALIANLGNLAKGIGA
jgi:hypothetical protein